MILKDDVVLLRDFKREDIAKRIEWETVKTEWQMWDAPWEYEGLTEEQKKRSCKGTKSDGEMGGTVRDAVRRDAAQVIPDLHARGRICGLVRQLFYQ